MESAEHAWIGDQITLEFGLGAVPAAGLQLYAGPGSLTYGQCIALGGDFYGVVGAPISTSPDPEAAFTAAFETLRSAWDEMPLILVIMAEEIAAVGRAMKAGQEPSLAYAALGDTLSYRWNRATGGGSAVSDVVPMGRYLLLAAENWDHFTYYAVQAYRAGHAVAMREAAAAGREADDTRKVRLERAYAMNAFADHFLTDLFSAGHLRAPRKALYDQVTTSIPGHSGSLGSLLARCMHDEDSYQGLKVSNAAGDSWMAYGDKRLLDPVSKANRDMVVRAVQASADGVWQAYQGGQGHYQALEFIPDLDRVGNVTTKENFSPLFRMQDGVAARRNDVADRQDYSWTKDWWGWTTYTMLHKPDLYGHAKCCKYYNASAKKFVGWLGVTGNNYVSVEKEEKNAHGVRWDVSDGELYLRKDTAPTDRWLGEGSGGYAGWGLGGGYYAPVLYNEDLTISLKSDPTRKLYLAGDNEVRWSDSGKPAPAGLLYIELSFHTPSVSC